MLKKGINPILFFNSIQLKPIDLSLYCCKTKTFAFATTKQRYETPGWDLFTIDTGYALQAFMFVIFNKLTHFSSFWNCSYSHSSIIVSQNLLYSLVDIEICIRLFEQYIFWIGIDYENTCKLFHFKSCWTFTYVPTCSAWQDDSE
jgi:hypothetical protein